MTTAGKEVDLGDLMVVKFVLGGRLDLGSSLPTVASNCDSEKEISPYSSAEMGWGAGVCTRPFWSLFDMH